MASKKKDLSQEDLINLFDNKNTDELKDYGGIDGIAKILKTDKERGLTKEEANSPERIAKYGRNVLPEPPSKSLLTLIFEGLQDKTLIMLIIAATVSLILGITEDPKSGWIEGTAILCAVVIVVMVSSINDYQKEKQFRKLNEKKNNKPVKVIRDGQMETISVYDVMVGDLVDIETGDILCADGFYVDGYSMRCDESSMTGESDACKKNEDMPFLFASCQVLEGVGKMIVGAVGPHSIAGRTMMLLQKPQEDTPLQAKLSILADQIAKFGMGAAGAILVSLTAKLVYHILVGAVPFSFETVFGSLIKYVVTSITVVVVAVPEGLPLAVTIALAYSMTKMLSDNNLVRHLEACETMGGATTICSDKTGTLTTNRMTVAEAYVAGTKTTSFEEMQAAMGKKAYLLWDLICSNSTAAKSTNEKGVTEFIGSKTECALLGVVDALGMEYDKIRKSCKVLKLVPFSSARKRMSVAVVDPNDKKSYVYAKGASEIILGKCTRMLTAKGEVKDMSEAERGAVAKVIEGYAAKSLRTIGLAYREVDAAKDKKSLAAEAADSDVERLEEGLVLIGIAGIKDPLRPEVPRAVKDCAKAGIIVRMVTGDNINTARAIATECGILDPNDKSVVAIEGPNFRALSEEERFEIAPKIRVMARSSPTDKHMLVNALKRNGHVVAVTGDGTNDAPALKEAHVGFAMGIAGTEVSKEASDIILMDDNFSSIVKAAMWGRNVYDSIRKFLQFQLTVNIVAVLVAFIGAVTNSKGEPPLKPVQLLWVNLIMDTMAALALATDAPSPDLLDRPPYSKTESLITKRMALNVVGQGIFQLIVNLLILYVPSIFGVERDSTEHLTCVFNVFVIMQVFNEINSRSLTNKFDIFKGFFRNTTFVAVIAFTAVMQFLIVEYGGDFASTRPLNLHQWLMCVGISALGIPVCFILKQIPLPGEAEEELKQKKKAEEAEVCRMVKDTNVYKPYSSDAGRNGWIRLKKALPKVKAIGAFKKVGFADSIRRTHRIDTSSFTVRGYNPNFYAKK